MYNLSTTALEGKDALTSLTGCMRPCKSIVYDTIPLGSWNMENVRDTRGQNFMDGNSSSLVFISHVPKTTTKRLEEQPKYTAVTFISDVGGIVGVFLGMSFWSFYQMFFFPLLNQVQNMILDHRYMNSHKDNLFLV